MNYSFTPTIKTWKTEACFLSLLVSSELKKKSCVLVFDLETVSTQLLHEKRTGYLVRISTQSPLYPISSLLLGIKIFLSFVERLLEHTIHKKQTLFI